MQRLNNKKTPCVSKKNKKTLYGDTIVEAVVAIAIYSIVAVLALGSMNSGLSTAQRNLESTMSRSMIDSESEALRYYYESFVAVKGGKSDDAFYTKIWNRIRPEKNEQDPYSLDDPALDDYTCAALMKADSQRVKGAESIGGPGIDIFALSGRGALGKASGSKDVYGFSSGNIVEANYLNYQILNYSDDPYTSKIIAAPLYPRITYYNMTNNIVDTSNTSGESMDILNGEGAKNGSDVIRQSRTAYRAEGVWIFPKKTKTGYDFFVRTCWNPVGSKAPSTFTSVVRLYNAD